MKNKINFKNAFDVVVKAVKYNFKLKLFSLIFGFFVWALVIGTVNPVVTRSFENIPIKFTNQGALEKNKLILVESSIETVSVTVKGNRNDVVALNKNDIIAQANIEDYLGSGTHKLKINLTIPGNVKVDSFSDYNVLVTLDKEVTKEFDISVEIVGKLKNANQIVATKEPSDKKVSVTGAISVINKINKVVALVDVNNMEKDEVVPAKLFAYDDLGKEIKKIKLNKEDTNVSISFQHFKEVPIELVTLNSTDKDIKIIKSDVVPNVISIIGNVSKLEGITSVKTKPLDLTQIKESGFYPITLELPSDTSVVNSGTKIVVNIDVDKKIEKTLNINKSDITVLNDTQLDLKNDIPDTVQVTLKGYESVISKLSSSNVDLSVKVVKNGNHYEGKLEMKPIFEVELVGINPFVVNFTEK